MTAVSGKRSFPNSIFDRDLLNVIVGGILCIKGSGIFGLLSLLLISTTSFAEIQPHRLSGNVMRYQSELFASDSNKVPSFIIDNMGESKDIPP